MHKRLRAMELAKTVRPDDLKVAHRNLERVVEQANGDVKNRVEAARTRMQQADAGA
jgi:ribosome recycling factor